jgi:hypothetical protein
MLSIQPRSRGERETDKEKMVILDAFLHLDINKADDYIIFLSKCNKDIYENINDSHGRKKCPTVDIQDVP